MTSIPTTPAFPEGSAVRDRVTGREYTSTGTTLPQYDHPRYWTIVHSTDGIDRQFPTDELELVEGVGSDDTPADGVTPNHAIPGTPVRNRTTGETYTVAYLDNPGQSTWVRRDDDGKLDVIPTDELAAVAL